MMVAYIPQLIIVEAKVYIKSASFRFAAVLLNIFAGTAFFLAGQVSVGIVQLLLPVLLFMAFDYVTRDRRVHFEEIAYACPHGRLYRISSQALSILLIFILLGIELLLTALLAEGLGLPVYISWSVCCAFLARYIVACINVIGITFFVDSLTKNTVRHICILFFWWLTGVFLTSNIGILVPQWAALFNFTFIHGFWGNPSYTAGLYPYTKLIAAIICFQIISSTMLIIAAEIIRKARRRQEKIKLNNIALPAISCIFIIGAAFHFAYQYFSIQSNMPVYKKTNYIASTMDRHDGQTTVIPLAYDLDIRLEPVTHKLTVKARITLKPADNASLRSIEFTLRDYFRVQQVIDVATGQALAWRQQGPYFTVNYPSKIDTKIVTVEISYSGKVWEWSADFFGQPAGLVNFVDTDFTCLRGGHAWYPILGRHPLYEKKYYSLAWSQEKKETDHLQFIWHKAVPFQMTVDSDKTTTIISNLDLIDKSVAGSKERHKFFSPDGRNVFLLAGPYEVTQLASSDMERLITLYHFAPHNHNLHAIANWVSNLIKYYKEWVPLENNSVAFSDTNCIVFEAPRILAYNNLGQPNFSGFPGVLPLCENGFTTKTYYSPWWQHTAHTLLQANYLKLWWPNCFSNANGDMADGMALYMYTLFMEQRSGKKFYENAREYWLAYNDDTPDNEAMLNCRGRSVREVFLLLDHIRKSKLGDEGVKRFLRAVHSKYQEKGRLDVTDIVVALEGIGAFTGDVHQSNRNAVLAANCRKSINNLTQLQDNPPASKVRGTLTFKLTAEFTPQIKIVETQ